MRIGFVTGEYPPLEGGVGAYTRELGRALVETGHTVGVFTRRSAESCDDGITVEAAVEGPWDWRTLRQIVGWASRKQIDIVSIQFQTAAFDMHPAIHWLPARFKTVPAVVTFHDLREPYLFPKAHLIGARQWIMRKLARDADGVINTERADEVRLRDEWRIRSVAWIPIGSNISAAAPPGFDRDTWRDRLGLKPDDLLISYFGFLNESKGGLILIDALGALHEQGVPAHLVMIGGRAGASDATNYAYAQRVDQRIVEKSLTSHVHWTGFMDDAGVSSFFLTSDICALPYTDGVSLRRGTLMAALAHGMPIVTTEPAHPIPELEGAFITVPLDDPDRLAKEIVALWSDAGFRDQLRKAALTSAEAFRWDRIAEKTVSYFQSLLTPQV